jgi:hypothetical protein
MHNVSCREGNANAPSTSGAIGAKDRKDGGSDDELLEAEEGDEEIQNMVLAQYDKVSH